MSPDDTQHGRRPPRPSGEAPRSPTCLTGTALGLGLRCARQRVLDEACTVLRRLWTETEPFDFHGSHLDLLDGFCNPKPAAVPC